MPFYEYECDACSARHEALQRLSEEPLIECPVCGAAALKRLISAPAFRLKGGGWYETDFKSGNQRNLADKPEAKSETKTDNKTDGGTKAAEPTKTAPAKPDPKPAAKGSGAE